MLKKVLIVDDEEEILKLLVSIFETRTEYKISVASDGEQGIRVAREEKPDLILLDVLLPNKNGFEVCQVIKSDPSTSFTKVIMLTGMTQNLDLQKGWDSGVDAYIAKPFDIPALLNKIEELLRNSGPN